MEEILELEALPKFNEFISAQHEEIDNYLDMPTKSRAFTVLEDLPNRTLIVQFEDGKKLNLQDFLPKGYILIPGTDFSVTLSKSCMMYNREKLEVKGILLTLFHEIGHAHLKSKFYMKLGKLLISSPLIIFEGYRTIFRLSKMANIDLKKAASLYLSLDIMQKVPVFWLEFIGQTKAAEEREAWAYGLIKLRQLARQGYDVFSEFTHHEVVTYISAALHSYDLGHQLDRINNINIVMMEDKSLAGESLYDKRHRFYSYLRKKRFLDRWMNK